MSLPDGDGDDGGGFLLVLADPPWPADSGGDLRNVAIHRSLSAIGRTRTVVFPLRRAVDRALSPVDLVSYPMPLPSGRAARVGLRLRATIRRRHPFTQRLIEGAAGAVLRREIETFRPAACVLTFPVVGPLAAVVRSTGTRTIVDLGEVRGPISRRRLGRGGPLDRLRAVADLIVAAPMERIVAAVADDVWFAGPEDAAAFAAATGRQDARVIPNAIVVDAYARYRAAPPVERTLSYVGSFDYPPNLEAAERLLTSILPRLRSTSPAATLRLVGRRPPPGLVALAATTPGVELLADVPDALAAIAGTSPLVVPLRSGAGTKLKILEGAAAGIPIVSSAVGLTGLAMTPGIDCLLAEDDASFVAAILEIWRSPELADRLRLGAEGVVRRDHDQAGLDRQIRAAVTSRGA